LFQSLKNNLLFDFLRNLVPEGSGLGLFGAQALHAIFQIPAIPVIESTTIGCPALSESGGNTFSTVQTGNTVLASEAINNVGNLLFGGILLAGFTADDFNNGFTRYFLVHNNSLYGKV
jgi:hypothetical protein